MNHCPGYYAIAQTVMDDNGWPVAGRCNLRTHFADRFVHLLCDISMM